MPPKQARRPSRTASAEGSTTNAQQGGENRTGAPRILCASDVRLGGIPDGLPSLSGEAAEIAAGASRSEWNSLLDAAVAEADALVLTGRLLDPNADLRAERTLRNGLERLAESGVTVVAVTDEVLPDDLPLTTLVPNEPTELELPRGSTAIAVLRVLAGAATLPVPDGLPALGVTARPAADGDGTIDHDCDALFHTSETGPGTLITLPETAGAGGGKAEPRGVRPLRLIAPTLDLPNEPSDLADRLREAAPPRDAGERLRIVNWTLRVGPWGDRLMEEGAEALAASLSGRSVIHAITVLPHPDRFDDRDDAGGDEPGEAAAFLEALSHFDPLGDASPALAGFDPDPDRVRTLAARFAAPLLSAG